MYHYDHISSDEWMWMIVHYSRQFFGVLLRDRLDWENSTTKNLMMVPNQVEV